VLNSIEKKLNTGIFLPNGIQIASFSRLLRGHNSEFRFLWASQIGRGSCNIYADQVIMGLFLTVFACRSALVIGNRREFWEVFDVCHANAAMCRRVVCPQLFFFFLTRKNRKRKNSLWFSELIRQDLIKNSIVTYLFLFLFLLK